MGFWRMVRGEEPGPWEALVHGGDKGAFGEYLVTYALTHDNVPGYAATAADLYVPSGKGNGGGKGRRTAQIDAVMVHEKGVFVFESKNYGGRIEGARDDAQWTQVLGGTTYRFYNPLRQNRAHVRALADFLGVDEKRIFSFVVFSERCALAVGRPGRREAVVRRPDLVRRLRRTLWWRPLRFSRGEVDAMAAALRGAEGASGLARWKHVREARRSAALGVCPLCGSPLARREGRYGPFVGCTAYPGCRYTRPR